MDRNAATLLEFISRLTYSVEGLSAKLRLYYSQFLTFHFSKTLSINQIQEIENRRASTPFANDEQIAVVGRELSIAERCWAIAAIGVLREEAERLDDRVVSRRLSHLVADLIRILELGDSVEAIGVEQQSIKEEIRRYEERPVVRIPAAIWPMSLDFILRCATLLYFTLEDLNNANLAPLNAPLTPALVILLAIFYWRRSKKANLRILESYYGAGNFTTKVRVSATQYTWLAAYLIASTFISYLLAGTNGLGEWLHVLTFLSFLVYYSVYLRFFNVGRISENDLVRQLDEKEQRTDTLDVDENDEMIVSLETKLNSSTSRLDAYVLESALFGALSFSGFLQIMASDLVSFSALEAFAANIFGTSQAFINHDWISYEQGLALLNNKVTLFCLVSVESLVCSIFFIAVIASRLRFSDIADKVRTAINLARAFNEKEEALYHESETSDVRQSRLLALTAKVNRQLFEAGKSLRRIDPVMAYMEYFRNAGILVFLVILITSSLFITSVLGWTFLVLIGATYFYFNRERISVSFRATILQLRILFLRWSVWIFVAAITPFIIAMVLRNSFFWSSTGELEALGYFLVGLFLSVWFLLASHYDEEFGDIEQKENRKRMSRWNLVRNFLAVMIFIYCVGMGFKILHLAGADEMVLVGISMLTWLMYFAGYYLSKIKWLGVISGSMLGTASTGVLFKTLHLAGASEMLLVGVIGSFLLLIIIVLKRKAFHSLYIRVCLVVLLLSFTMWTNAFLRLELAYAHRNTDVAPFLRLLLSTSRETNFASDAGVLTEVESTESYISKYGNDVPFGAVYQELVRIYNHHGEEKLSAFQYGSHDTSILKTALMVVEERDRILDLYDYPTGVLYSVDLGLKADVLLLLNRREEAEAYLNALLGELKGEDHRNEVMEKLASIRAL